jgi:RNA polymerase sigma-70 factor (ECF subfamily)
MKHLAAASTGADVTRYHLEAGIAACHALAADFESTDWRQILCLYDQLVAKHPSPVIAMNRALALAQVEGPSAGLAALDAIESRSALENYHLFHAAVGQLWFQRGDMTKATGAFRRALERAALPAERALLEQRLARCAV